MAAVTRPHHVPGLLAYLAQQKIAVFSAPIDTQGTPHAAAIVFSHSETPFAFFFVTEQTSQKCRLLQKNKTTPAALVVGTYNHADFTLQMRGQAALVDPDDYKDVIEQYHTKRGNTNDNVSQPGMVLVRFVPTWARCTDYANGKDPVHLKL